MQSSTTLPKCSHLKETREPLNLTHGQKMQVIAYENRIELIPVKPPASVKGFLKGIDTDILRERDRV